MELEKIKKHLQNYLDEVLTPAVNRELVGNEDEPITLTVNALRIGSYNPPIFHIFIDINPKWKYGMLMRAQRDIEDFMRIFSIDNRIKIHWNKRPAF